MKLVEPEPTCLPRDASLAVYCPEGCIRGTIYFDSHAVSVWLGARGQPSTIEQFKAVVRCSVCGERPTGVRIIGQLTSTKLGRLPGMP